MKIYWTRRKNGERERKKKIYNVFLLIVLLRLQLVAHLTANTLLLLVWCLIHHHTLVMPTAKIKNKRNNLKKEWVRENELESGRKLEWIRETLTIKLFFNCIFFIFMFYFSFVRCFMAPILKLCNIGGGRKCAQ